MFLAALIETHHSCGALRTRLEMQLVLNNVFVKGETHWIDPIVRNVRDRVNKINLWCNIYDFVSLVISRTYCSVTVNNNQNIK